MEDILFNILSDSLWKNIETINNAKNYLNSMSYTLGLAPLLVKISYHGEEVLSLQSTI